MGNTKDNHKDGNSSSNSNSKTVMNLTNNHINDHSVRFYGAKVSDCEMKQQNILQYVKSQNSLVELAAKSFYKRTNGSVTNDVVASGKIKHYFGVQVIFSSLYIQKYCYYWLAIFRCC